MPAAPAQVLVILAAPDDSFAQGMLEDLNQLHPEWHCLCSDGAPTPAVLESAVLEQARAGHAPAAGVAKLAMASCVYVPALAQGDGLAPDLVEARRYLQSPAVQQSRQLILLSSALIYGTGPGRNRLAAEGYSFPGNNGGRIPSGWRALEAMAGASIGPQTKLTILRPAIVPGWTGWLGRLLSSRLVLSLPGHDPALQFLSRSDLAAAVSAAVTTGVSGIFNVAPDGVVPLRQAIRLIRRWRLPIPRTLRRLFRTTEALELIRYSWTASDAKIKSELGFAPGKSSLAALRESYGRGQDFLSAEPRFDEFGMDEDYIRFFSKTLFRFLADFYWRIEEKGSEHIPRSGPGVLVGLHRGFMPWDGVMALHTVGRKTGRYPRFLTHPALLKFPFLANFMTKLGGLPACLESAGHILQRRELLGIFPEGIRGAFASYRGVYKLKAFGRDAFVKVALRYGAPIVPFVTLGSAETFPILGKIKSRRWTGYTGWPFIPITPTFPVFPLPLPSKWHTQFLQPINLDQYPPEAADDPAVVKAISRQVRVVMQKAIDDMLCRRRSIFFGSIFHTEAG
jgi:1-acyl-sn-glycerol-3-phosphate acyltransferase